MRVTDVHFPLCSTAAKKQNYTQNTDFDYFGHCDGAKLTIRHIPCNQAAISKDPSAKKQKKKMRDKDFRAHL